MTVTAPCDPANDTPERWGHLIVDSRVLCAEFVEHMVSEARASAAREDPGQPIPEVDWDRIWAAGRDAPSAEASIGRIIRAASEEVQRITRGPRAPLATPPETVISEPTVTAGSAATGSFVLATPAPDSTLAPPAPQESDGGVAGVQVPGAASPGAAIRTAPPPTETVRTSQSLAGIDETQPLEAVKDVAVERKAQRRAGWVTVFTWIRNVGAVILLFVVWQLWGTAISQHQAQGQLQSQFEASLRAHHQPKTTKPTLVPASAFLASGGNGSVVAHLEIPAIGVDQYVVEGTTDTDLSKGPGHYVGTAMPGQAGNVAIAGHRTTHGAPFNRLGAVVPGDRIVLTTTSGERFTYVVSGAPQVVSPHDVAVLNYYGDNRITLTTCNPEFSSSQRLIVVGELKEPLGTPSSHAQHVSYHVADPGTANWNWSMLPLVGIEVCLLMLLGLTYGRFDGWFGRIGKWFILVPVWAVGLYLLFNSLTMFLPATY